MSTTIRSHAARQRGFRSSAVLFTLACASVVSAVGDALACPPSIPPGFIVEQNLSDPDARVETVDQGERLSLPSADTTDGEFVFEVDLEVPKVWAEAAITARLGGKPLEVTGVKPWLPMRQALAQEPDDGRRWRRVAVRVAGQPSDHSGKPFELTVGKTRVRHWKLAFDAGKTRRCLPPQPAIATAEPPPPPATAESSDPPPPPSTASCSLVSRSLPTAWPGWALVLLSALVGARRRCGRNSKALALRRRRSPRLLVQRKRSRRGQKPRCLH